MNKIKGAVIGLGVGEYHARTLNSCHNSELIWICDLNKDRLQNLGSEFHQTKQTQDEMKIFDDPEIDLVCIASYDEDHYDQIIRALNHDKNVYVEKPMCLTEIQAKNIRKILETKSHLHLSSNMVLRTCPLFQKIKKAINSNKIGKIYNIEADYYWGRKEKLLSGWRANSNFYSIIHGAGVHMIDLIMWITEKKPIKVTSLSSNIIVSGTKQRHDDFAAMLLEFDDQMIVKVTTHGGCVHPHFHGLKVFGENSTFVHETTGTVWINSSNPEAPHELEKEAYPAKEKRNLALLSFIDYLNDNTREILVTENDVFDVMSVCFAAEAATKSGDMINIQYL